MNAGIKRIFWLSPYLYNYAIYEIESNQNGKIQIFLFKNLIG